MHTIISRRQVLAGLTLAGACGAATLPLSPRAVGAENPFKVVATTGMIADAARRIGGAEVEVRGLMGPGVDPHSYRQTRTDIVAMARADVVLRHGLYLEAQMEDFMRQLAEGKPVYAVAERLPKELLIAHDVYPDKFDPHVWMDPTRWQRVVGAIQDALAETRPTAASAFAESTKAYLTEIASLADYAARVLATVPADRRVLVTAHDAFSYFGAAFDFEVVGIQGISTESEAGLNRIAQLVDLLVDRRIAAVFVESSVSDRNIRALVEGAGAKGHEVEIGGQLYSDAMGETGTYEGTYLGMIDHNVTTIARALGGEAPLRGMAGKLTANA